MRLTRIRVTITAKLRKGSFEDVASFFGLLRRELGPGRYSEAFPLMLTDNEPYFARHGEIEGRDEEWRPLARVFYCHPYPSWEKSSVKATNGRVRGFVPKGEFVDSWTAAEVASIGARMNRRAQEALGGATPEELFRRVHGDAAWEALKRASAEWARRCDESGKLR